MHNVHFDLMKDICTNEEIIINNLQLYISDALHEKIKPHTMTFQFCLALRRVHVTVNFSVTLCLNVVSFVLKCPEKNKKAVLL